MADINKAKKRQIGANANYYKVQMGRTDDNKRKRIARHLRTHPGDRQAAKISLERYNRKPPEKLTSKGRKNAARWAANDGVYL